jgi:hypothetical protein
MKSPSPAGSAFAGRLPASSGSPLDARLRSEMEWHFGHDFAHVRVHDGVHAAQAAEAVGARAFTVGLDIVFGAGRFAPGMQSGRRLIAHELTHVVQQQGDVRPSGSSDPTGAKAGKVAELGAASRPLTVQLSAPVGVQRDQDPTLPQPPRGTGAYAAWIGDSLVAVDVGTDWPSEEVRARFFHEYLDYARSHPGRRGLYEQAAKDYPQAAELERRLRRHGQTFGTRKRIRVIEVLVPETKFGTPLGSVGSRMFSQAEPVASYETEIDQPDASAGFNFDTYIMNVSTGQRIAAQHLGGERFRVLMGSQKCPGCHFGHGLEVEFHGESFVVALAPQILGAASVMGRTLTPRRMAPPPVADAEVVAANARNPASIRPQDPRVHQLDWQDRGGVGKAPTAYRDASGAIRLTSDSWLLKPATRAGIPPVSPTGSPPTARPATPAPARPSAPAERISGTADTGRAPVSPPADPLAQTPAAPAPAAPAKPPPAPVVAKDAPTGAAVTQSQRPQAPVVPKQIDPPQAISEPAVREIQNRPRPAQPTRKGQGNNVGYTQNAEQHQLAWQRVGGHGPAPPAFTYDGQVYLDPSRWPPRR